MVKIRSDVMKEFAALRNMDVNPLESNPRQEKTFTALTSQ